VKAPTQNREEQGFSILELLIAMAIFLAICGAMFELLRMSQQKYSGETQLSAAYQDSRLAMDQIVRDFNIAGYPPADMFSVLPSATSQYAITPVAWIPGYTNVPPSPCALGQPVVGGGTCGGNPGDYDLVIETRIPPTPGDPPNPPVSWICYHYDRISLTLYRDVVQKTAGSPPSSSQVMTDGTALLKNVMNSPGSLMSQIVAQNATMFPGGVAQPIFQYTCDTPGGPMPCWQAPAANNSPKSIRDVDVTLIVMTPQQDLETQSLKLVELFGRGHRSNPAN
jgi:prepilin-type N-terminal cleavage/methylation domain-containing protein